MIKGLVTTQTGLRAEWAQETTCLIKCYNLLWLSDIFTGAFPKPHLTSQYLL